MEKRVVVVTGGATGIGLASSKKFAAKGDIVIIAGRREEKGRLAVQEIEAAGGEAIFVQTDVSKESDVKNLIDTAVERYGRIDVLFNNAGVPGKMAGIYDLSSEDYREVLDIDVMGVVYGTMYASRAMIEKKIKGVIINTTSELGIIACTNMSPYNMAKGAVKLFTMSAAADLGKYGIRVVSVAPGTIETPMVAAALANEEDARMIRNNHMRKQVLKAEDVANVVYFLSTEESTVINGCDVSVDDGFAYFKDWKVVE